MVQKIISKPVPFAHYDGMHYEFVKHLEKSI